MTLRIALLGAFPYPAPQGSQVFARDQARALQAAGARISLLCYGHGVRAGSEDFEILRTPAALSPRRIRSGPSPAKPTADAALLALLVGEARRRRFQAVLAHNAEAAALALVARTVTRIPVVYVVHTLWRHELPTYGPAPAAERLGRIGAALDAGLARRVDAVLALTAGAARTLGRDARGPVAVIPPGLDRRLPPGPDAVRAVCKKHELRPGRFALYAGNLDRYQNLEDLAAAAARLPDVAFVVATHDPTGPPLSPLRIVPIADPEEGRALTFGAGVCVLSRRRAGGFPVKLLNYMEAARPIVARRRVAEGLEHERSALLLPDAAGPEALAASVARLLDDAALAASIGRGARGALERGHAWPKLAADTLELIDAVRAVG